MGPFCLFLAHSPSVPKPFQDLGRKGSSFLVDLLGPDGSGRLPQTFQDWGVWEAAVPQAGVCGGASPSKRRGNLGGGRPPGPLDKLKISSQRTTTSNPSLDMGVATGPAFWLSANRSNSDAERRCFLTRNSGVPYPPRLQVSGGGPNTL